MSGLVAATVAPVTSDSGFKYSKCNGEVGGDGEGDLLSEWTIDLDFLTIHSSCPPSSTKNVDASKITASTSGKTTRSRP